MALDDIPTIPAIPGRLQRAAVRGTLIPFVGAGASRVAGCPGWDDFANRALGELVKAGKLSFAELDQLMGVSARVKLSLARSLEAEHNLTIPFGALLHPDGLGDPKGRRLYSGLSRLARVFITTNYDEWLDSDMVAPSLSVLANASAQQDASRRPRRPLYDKSEFTVTNLDLEGSVIHLHGSIKDAKSMIVTTRDYLTHYGYDQRPGKENGVLTFLATLFRQKTVLFVGYGLDELEILEYVIEKSPLRETGPLQARAKEEPRHFLLQGFFSHERALMQKLTQYYGDLGIGLLPFNKDEKGWDQLIDVVEDFAGRIPVQRLAEIEELTAMAELLDD